MELAQSICVSYQMYVMTVMGSQSTRFVGFGIAVTLGGLITAVVQVRIIWFRSIQCTILD